MPDCAAPLALFDTQISGHMSSDFAQRLLVVANQANFGADMEPTDGTPYILAPSYCGSIAGSCKVRQRWALSASVLAIRRLSRYKSAKSHIYYFQTHSHEILVRRDRKSDTLRGDKRGNRA